MLTQIKQVPNKVSMISNLVSLNLRELLENICEAYGIQNPPSFFFYHCLLSYPYLTRQYFFVCVAHLLMLSKHST